MWTPYARTARSASSSEGAAMEGYEKLGYMALNVSDAERATKAVAGVVGKRMTYKDPDSRQNSLS